jgi:signal peptidase I
MPDSEKNSTAAPGEAQENQPGLAAKAESEAIAADQARQARRVHARKEVREWIVSIAVALIAVFLIRSFLFTIIRVDGDSMKETLHNGERLIVTVLDVKLNGVQRDDVVICHYPGRTGMFGLKENFVKRVVGVAGDKIVMLNGETYINGVKVDEPFITYPSPMIDGAWEVPEGCVFVCGDNRANSHDSRSSDVGVIQASEIVGKVRLVMWPVSAWRVVN